MNSLETAPVADNTAAQPTPPREPRARLNWKLWLGLVLAAVCAWIFRPSASRATSSAAAHDEPSVAAVKVLRTDLWREQVFDAEFRPYEEIELHAKVPGFVDTLTVDVGDRVTNGQCLATLEVPELKDDLDHAMAAERRSEEEAKKAQAEHDEAHEIYTHLAAVQLAKPNLIAQQDIDLAQAKDRGAEAAMATAKEQIHVSQADVRKLQTMMKYTVITAPFDGVITRRFTDPGALIHNGGSGATPLVRLSQNTRLRLVFPVSVPFVPQIKLGDPVEIRVQSLAKPLAGKISRFTRKIEMTTRTMEAEVDVPNPDLTLVPGMYASVIFRFERRPHTLAVPVEAVEREKTSTVYRISPEGKLEERAVQVGLETPDKLEVLSGLAENDLVMIGSRGQLKPGQKVEPKMIASKEKE